MVEVNGIYYGALYESRPEDLYLGGFLVVWPLVLLALAGAFLIVGIIGFTADAFSGKPAQRVEAVNLHDSLDYSDA
ncbi:hypothetical protein ACOME3_002684 [Neoechinorhynchus agilis]